MTSRIYYAFVKRPRKQFRRSLKTSEVWLADRRLTDSRKQVKHSGKLLEPGLLIFDELSDTTNNRNIEHPLLELFQDSISHHSPTFVTANLKRSESETAYGSRLLDRLPVDLLPHASGICAVCH